MEDFTITLRRDVVLEHMQRAAVGAVEAGFRPQEDWRRGGGAFRQTVADEVGRAVGETVKSEQGQRIIAEAVGAVLPAVVEDEVRTAIAKGVRAHLKTATGKAALADAVQLALGAGR